MTPARVLTETLTVLRLGVPPTLARTLRSTNAIESMISSAGPTWPTSSAGVTGRWRCAGAPPPWSRAASSSAGSTATCTCAT
jgi:putative transposase